MTLQSGNISLTVLTGQTHREREGEKDKGTGREREREKLGAL